MRLVLIAAAAVVSGWAMLVPPPALATPGFSGVRVETSLEKVAYWRRQYRRYWRNGYPVPYAYYPPAYGYYVPPSAYAYYPPYGYAPPPPPNYDYPRRMATANTRPEAAIESARSAGFLA
jgi:hypothetical protein